MIIFSSIHLSQRVEIYRFKCRLLVTDAYRLQPVRCSKNYPALLLDMAHLSDKTSVDSLVFILTFILKHGSVCLDHCCTIETDLT